MLLVEVERERGPKLGVRGTPQVAHKPSIILTCYQRNTFTLIHVNYKFVSKTNQRKVWPYEFLFYLFINFFFLYQRIRTIKASGK